MSSGDFFHTATMAKVLADQGRYKEAAEIYRRLLTETPGRQDLAEKLAEIEGEIAARTENGYDHLSQLMEQWIRLVVTKVGLPRLLRLQRALMVDPAGTGHPVPISHPEKPHPNW